MSSAFVSKYYNMDEVIIRQNIKNDQMIQQQHLGAERRNTIGGTHVDIQRNMNYSMATFGQVPNTQQQCMISMDNQSIALTQDHKKLDRSCSEPCDMTMNNTDLNMNVDMDNQNQKNVTVNSSRYKTELCRPFEESGNCKYADKCQFAHGAHELRSLSRHPKYKTELCRTFHSKGFCPYGPRCNFVHEDLKRLNQMVQNDNKFLTNRPPMQQLMTPPSLSQSPPPIVQRPASINFNSSFNGSLGSTADSSPPSSVGSESPSLSPVFFGEEYPMMNPCNSLPVVPNPISYSSSTNVDVFRNVSHFNKEPPMELQPLNIQTHLNNSDLGLLEQQFNMYMNLNNQSNFNANNTTTVFSEWDPTLIGAPLNSPDSISGDSVGSSLSSASSLSHNQHSVCGSPLEVGKNFRLPVFNHIAQDDL